MHSCKRTQPPLISTRRPIRKHYFEQFHAWAAGMNAQAQIGSEGRPRRFETETMRPNVQSKLPFPRHSPRRSHPVRRARVILTEQGAVSECEQPRPADPDTCNRVSEKAWRNPFPGATAPPARAYQLSTIDPAASPR